MSPTTKSGDGDRRTLTREPGRRTDKISEAVAREIVDDIVSRNLGPGSMLPPESVMLKSYDVGRASLREALRILEVHGLITIKPGPGGGPVVGSVSSRNFGKTTTLYLRFSRATFSEVVSARLVMEPVMAGLAARRDKDAEMTAVLSELIERNRSAIGGDDRQYMEASTEFHSAIAGMSGNRVLDIFGRGIKDIYTERVSSLEFPEGARKRSLHAHEGVAKAILKGNSRLAERLMREHMEEFGDWVAEQFPGLMNEVVTWH